MRSRTPASPVADGATPPTPGSAPPAACSPVVWLRRKPPGEEGDVLSGAVRLLADAFHADPFHRWLYPDPGVRAQALPHIFAALLPRSAVACAGDPLDPDAIMAVHHPARPPVGGGDALRAVRSIPVPRQPFRALRVAASVWQARPRGNAVVLELLAVHERARGRGLARRLLDPVLAWCDNERVLAHLETTLPDNLPLYERFGFETHAMIAHGTPPTWIMRRLPR